MPLSPARFSLPRRRFLGAAGAAALAVSPLAGAALAVSPAGALRLGVVLPKSTRYPQLADQLLGGFEAFATSPRARSGRAIALVPIACESGARAPFLAAGEAVKNGRVDMLAGLVDRNQACRMAPLLEERGVPFVVCDMGADIARVRRESPQVVRNSLGYWQSSYAMGQWAPAHLGARVLIATDFLESGYDMVYAFRQAFEAAGGEVAGVKVTGLPDGSGAFSEVAEAMRSLRPDFVYAFYSGRRAEAFLRFYVGEQLSSVAPLAGAGLLTDAATLASLPRGSEGVITVSTWATDLQGPENAELRAAYRRVRGAEPSPFAVLGYETAQRIASGLAHTAWIGPRGAVVACEAMCDTSSPVYLRRVARTPSGLANVTTARLPAVEVPEATGRAMRAMIKTGWAQAYLAA